MWGSRAISFHRLTQGVDNKIYFLWLIVECGLLIESLLNVGHVMHEGEYFSIILSNTKSEYQEMSELHLELLAMFDLTLLRPWHLRSC